MQSKRQNKEVSAVIISIVLHVILFGLLILGSLYHRIEIMGGGEGDGDVMGAVMVDTGVAAQEWGRLQQQQKGNKNQAKKPEPEVKEKPDQPDQEEIARQQEIEKQKALEKQKERERQKEIEKQKELERQKQLEEQKKQEEKARLEALEKQKKAEEAKAKERAEAAKLKEEAEAKRLAALAKQAEEEAKAKAAEETKRKAEKAKAEAEAKAKAEKAKAEKAEAEAKAKAEKAKAEAKAKADKAKADKEKAESAQRKADQAALDDFFNGGNVGGGSATKGSNTNRQGSQGSGAALGAGDGGKTGDQYAGIIKREIQRRFLKEPGFVNKVCVVEVEFLRDGTISNYRRISGPDDICQAAMSAVARTKKVPAAPTDDIYQRYKTSPIEFKLR
ncbi:cell envelope integrity protein TolA [Pasteurella sp. PK-2025]|uniref:cell envelope integrity protein TolA n=1 Tax=Pasteurella sp. PK-2025 TaxID=3413133 RepID=UPI003C71682D